MRSFILIGIAILLLTGVAQAGDWPMFGHDAAHSGVADEFVEPPLELLWKYSGSFSSSATVSGGVVYAGSLDYNVYALDAKTGSLRWKYQTGNGVWSSPAISGGVVYVGSRDKNVYALDAVTGALIWKYTTGDVVDSSPTVAGDVVYVGSHDGSVYALNAASGSLNWKYSIGYPVGTSPAVSIGLIYVGSYDGVYALDAINGAFRWKYKTDGLVVDSSPAISGSLVYVGSRDKNVYALDAVTGALIWKYSTGSWVDSSPAVSGSAIYVGSWDKNVYALDALTGTLIWKFLTEGSVWSSPAVSGSLVYITGPYDHNMYAIDATTGNPKWIYATEGYSGRFSTISGSVVYVESNGNLYAFKESKMDTTPTPTTTSDIGYIYVWSSPAGGSIYLDGNYMGLTDSAQYIIISTTTGYHTVEISKEGYDKYLTSEYVYSNQGTTVTAYLTQTFTPASKPAELQDQTNWKLVSIVLALFLIGAVILLVHKSKEGTHIEKLFSTKYAVAIGLGTVLILFLILYSVVLGFIVLAIIIATGLLFGLEWVTRAFSITKSIIAICSISALSLLLIWYLSPFNENFVSIAIMVGIIIGLIAGWAWILGQIILWVLGAIVKAVRNRIYITTIGERFKKLIKGEKALKFEAEAPPKKSAPIEKPVLLSTRMEYPQATGTEKSTPEGKQSINMAIKTEIDSKPESKAVSPSESPRKGFGYKKAAILIIFLIVVGAIGYIGYTVYQKYSPLAELANCGNNCIDYKKVKLPQYETSVPDIKITEADAEKLIMDIPIIIYNPSMKDTETVKIDFDVFMERKHLTKGTNPAYELPAKQNTTILIKDVVIKYEELGDVLQKVAEKHGVEMVREGKANISMTIDLLIYFPIEVFSINIHTFAIPIQIETEVPVDMLKQNEEAKKQIEEKVKRALPVLTSTEQESVSNIVQHSNNYDGKTVTVNGQIIISSNPGNYIIDGNTGTKLEGNLQGLSEGFYKLTGVYNAEKNTITIQNSQKMEGSPATVEEALKLPNPFVAVKVQGLSASPPAFVENKLNSYLAIPGSPIEEIHTYVIYNNEGIYLIVNPHKSPQLNFSEATVTGTLIKTPPDKLELGKDFVPTDFKGIIIANEITLVNPIPATVKEINQKPENYAFKRVVVDGIYATGSSKLGYGKETAKEDLRIHLGAGLMGDEFLPDDTTKLIMSIDPVHTDWQIRKGKVTGTVIYPTKEIMEYFAQKGMNEVKELKPVLMVESISEDLVSVNIEDLITDLLNNNGQKYNGKVVNVTGYALGANVPVKEVAEKVARAVNPGLGEVVKMIPADVNVQGTAIADSPTPVMGQLPLAGLNSELIEKTQLMAGKYNFKVVVTMIDNKPMLFLVHKEELPFTVPTTIPTVNVIPTATPTLPTSAPTPSLPTPIATPTLPLPTPTLPGFP